MFLDVCGCYCRVEGSNRGGRFGEWRGDRVSGGGKMMTVVVGSEKGVRKKDRHEEECK